MYGWDLICGSQKNEENFSRKSRMYSWDLICGSQKMRKASQGSLVCTVEISAVQSDGRSKFLINRAVFGKRHHQLLAFSIL